MAVMTAADAAAADVPPATPAEDEQALASSAAASGQKAGACSHDLVLQVERAAGL
jgi:hypothetical protein